MESVDVRTLMSPDEVLEIGIEAMSDAQRQAIARWGLRMYELGEAIVGHIEEVKYGGRMIRCVTVGSVARRLTRRTVAD